MIDCQIDFMIFVCFLQLLHEKVLYYILFIFSLTLIFNVNNKLFINFNNYTYLYIQLIFKYSERRVLYYYA